MSASSANPEARPDPVPLAQAFWYWLQLGFISFGGPAGQIAIMHADLVERRRWISEARFLHALNYCMLLPGPEAQQLATYIGWLMHKTWGGVLAGVLFVLPSLFILTGLSWLYLSYGSLPAVAGLLYGIKPAVTAIVLFAAWRIGSRALKHRLLWLISAAAFIAVAAFRLPFPLVVLAAALTGWLGGKYAPQIFAAAGHKGSTSKTFGPALIDDNMAAPKHAQWSLMHALQVLLVFVGLWALALGGLTWIYGWSGVLTQMGWFFTKAALLTFGGAYAVLPYVFQGAVEQYQWLSAGQMMDGLALGETTPGPLIMVVAFVGYVGGATRELLGPGHAFAAGMLAASVVTLFTFLPSFLFILLGGPFIESTHGKLEFTAPLTGITAAVVGVILNLAMFFGFHALWPHGLAGSFDALAALITAVAFIALWRYRANVIAVIFACALLGAAMRWFA